MILNKGKFHISLFLFYTCILICRIKGSITFNIDFLTTSKGV